LKWLGKPAKNETKVRRKEKTKSLSDGDADLLTLIFLVLRGQGMCLPIGGFAAVICPWDTTTNPANFWRLLVMGIFGLFWFYELFFGCE